MDLSSHKKKAKENFSFNQSLSRKLKKSKPKNLDFTVYQAHTEAFEEIDCLDCANCCKNISPIITDKDIQRIAKYLKTKPGDLVEKYLELDNDGDYVFRKQPCPFLGLDNYCSIYAVRPKACAEYPHTNRKKFYQILDLSLKNTQVCPAVNIVFEKLAKIYD